MKEITPFELNGYAQIMARKDKKRRPVRLNNAAKKMHKMIDRRSFIISAELLSPDGHRYRYSWNAKRADKQAAKAAAKKAKK